MTVVDPLLVARVTAEQQRQRDVLVGVERRYQVVCLEDEPDRGTPQHRQFLVAQRGEVGVADVHRALRQRIEPGQAVHQRALARAGRAHDGREPAGFECDGHAVERANFAVARAVDLHRIHRARPQWSASMSQS